ncbi:MAG: sensor histidine kinase [Williamsia sp.]|nr:sensor histidine kinase [Williamsia sp.]
MTRLMFTLLLLAITTAGFSQLIKQTQQEVMTAYLTAPDDTSRIRLLLKLDSVYLYQKPDITPVLDSAVLMAKQAQAMSVRQRYRPGWEDATFMLANAYAEKTEMAAASKIADSVSGPLRIRILIMMGERYLFRPGEFKQNTDSAFFYIQTVEKASRSIGDRYWLSQSLLLKGKYYFISGDLESGRQCFQTMIDECRRNGRTGEEAYWLAELGRYMPHTDQTYDEVVLYLTRALHLYRQLGDKRNEIESLESLIFLHKLRSENLALAVKELQEVLTLRKVLTPKQLFLNHAELSEINILLGNYNIALLSAQAAVKNMEESRHEDFSGGIVYSQLAMSYKAVGDKDNSLLYFRKALEHLVQFRNEYLFPIGGKIVELLLEKDSAREALSFLLAFVKANPPQRIIDKEIVAACTGNCYAMLKQYDQAEKSYLLMIDLDAQAQAQMKKQAVGERSNTITGSEAYYTMGQFYAGRQQYEPAKAYLMKAGSFKHFAPSFERKSNIHGLLFKIDSAQGDFISAIQHLHMQQRLHDSLFTDRKSKQIAELQIQYATEKKEKDLQILSAQEQVKDKELQRTVQVRNYTYLIVAVLLTLIIVGYGRYAQNQRSKKKLEAQQAVIDRKNWQLQKLLAEKDRLLLDKDDLLEDKERLIREIHHRVKNNLQIVISLLNTQSKYLNNDEAIHAITESRHRMQAISLIHEKLYQSENTSSVNMQTYISELADHLRASFDRGSQILFQVIVDPVELDLSQAIPLGLILNEVITNAIKYAFADRKAGTILIQMSALDDEMILLLLKDNGVGWPAGMDVNKTSSMGIRLVNGLAKQLNARLSMEGKNGVRVELAFKAMKKGLFHSNEPRIDRVTDIA